MSKKWGSVHFVSFWEALWGIHVIYVEYSLGIRGIYICIGYVSGMYRVCIGKVLKGTGRKGGGWISYVDRWIYLFLQILLALLAYVHFFYYFEGTNLEATIEKCRPYSSSLAIFAKKRLAPFVSNIHHPIFKHAWVGWWISYADRLIYLFLQILLALLAYVHFF